MRRIVVIMMVLVLALGAVTLTGCSKMKKSHKGAIIGATAGGVVGALIGHKAGNTAVGAIMGAVVGGAAGAYIGHRMDQAAAEMEQDLKGAKIERVGEGILITWQSGILFDVNKADLRPEAKANIADLARILQKYPNTDIQVDGYTDTTGTNEWNMQLSKMRAESVGNYMSSQGIAPGRLRLQYHGEENPVSTDNTPEGLQKNRRVEVAVFANDKLKAEAEKQVGKG